MKKFTVTLLVSLFCINSFAQLIAKTEILEPIKGICDSKNVYVPFPMIAGQQEAKCPLSDKKIIERLNAEVVFLKDKPAYKDKGMLNAIINCKGEMVLCEMDNKTQSEELDRQIIAVFKTLGEWKPGKMDGDKVDTSKLWSFEIEDGRFKEKK